MPGSRSSRSSVCVCGFTMGKNSRKVHNRPKVPCPKASCTNPNVHYHCPKVSCLLLFDSWDLCLEHLRRSRHLDIGCMEVARQRCTLSAQSSSASQQVPALHMASIEQPSTADVVMHAELNSDNSVSMLQFDSKSKISAKMLVISGIRCGCHYVPRARCPEEGWVFGPPPTTSKQPAASSHLRVSMRR